MILESGRHPRRLTPKEICSDRPRRRLAERTRLDGPRGNRLRAADTEARTGPSPQASGAFAPACRLRRARSWPEPVRGGTRQRSDGAPPAAGPHARRSSTGTTGGSFRQPPRYGPPPGSPRDTGRADANRPRRRGVSHRLAAATARPAGQDRPATHREPAAGSTVAARITDRSAAARVVCRPDPGRRLCPRRSSEPRLASRVVQGHLRAGQSRPVARRDPAGRVGEQDQVGAARALQGRRDGQGRRREDDRVRQRRIGVRRAAPGRPRGGHRRRHRVRQAGQPGRPEGAGLLLGAGVRPASRDVRRRPQPGGQQRRRPVRAGRRGHARAPPRTGPSDLSGSDVAAGPLLHDLDHRLQLDHGHPGHPGGAAGSRRADRGVLTVGRRRGRGRSDDGLAGRPRTDRSAAAHGDRAQRLRRTRRQDGPGRSWRSSSLSQGQVVVEVPFDGHLRPGGVIDRHQRDVAGHAGAVSSRSPLRSPSTSPPATTGAGNATSRSA